MPDAPTTTNKRPRRNLTQEVVDALRKRIRSGELVPGDKLPTEQMLIAEYGVSRTVIREAISGLKADGLLNSRQGAGVFVQEPSRQDEAIALLSGNPNTIASIIESLELRAAVETGAAELAAQRCSPAQEAEIFSRYSAFRQKVVAGDRSEDEDFAFHVAIAEATNNRRFVDFLTLLGRNTIPRSELREKANMGRNPDLENRILAEHKALMDAISDRQPEAARDAMRAHLSQSAERYRVMARRAEEE